MRPHVSGAHVPVGPPVHENSQQPLKLTSMVTLDLLLEADIPSDSDMSVQDSVRCPAARLPPRPIPGTLNSQEPIHEPNTLRTFRHGHRQARFLAEVGLRLRRCGDGYAAGAGRGGIGVGESVGASGAPFPREGGPVDLPVHDWRAKPHGHLRPEAGPAKIRRTAVAGELQRRRALTCSS